MSNIDTITQLFVNKCVHVIVQSRLGTGRTKTKCNPNGKDFFNLDIEDMDDIVQQTTNCFKSISEQSSGANLSFVKKSWKICCEILLKNSDGTSLVLEYWIFSNVATTLSTNQEVTDPKQQSQMYQQLINRMSCMLKSLILITRSTPAYKLSSRGQSADSYVVCYRVYQCDNILPDVMNSTCQNNQFSQLTPLGTIKSLYNELSTSLLYRTSMNMDADSKLISTKADDNICDKDLMLSLKDDHFKPDDFPEDNFDVKEIFKPLNPAFADQQENVKVGYNTPFSALLSYDEDSSEMFRETSNHLRDTKSTPIAIPTQTPPKSKSPQIYSTSNDSFVFVELNAPFASEDREFSSFFHGPSPTFVSHSDDSSDINELTMQLAELESNAPQFDSFIESITESEELKFEA